MSGVSDRSFEEFGAIQDAYNEGRGPVTHASHEIDLTDGHDKGTCNRCAYGDWDHPEKLAEPCSVSPEQELAYLRYYHGEAQDAFGPADSDVDHAIAEGFDGVVPRGWDPRRHSEEDD